MSTTTTAPSFSAPIAVAPASRISLSARASQDGRPTRRIMRRMTSGDTGLQPSSSALKGYAQSDQDTAEVDTAANVPSRRRSWIQRLSLISNSPQSSRNPSPSPAQLSPAVSCSNGSMAFSHDGSTAPMIDRRRTNSPLPPNKLVKRSSSLRRPHEPPPSGAGSLRPSFRRPATSHQRSATLQHHRPLLEMTAEHSPIHEPVRVSTVSEPEYTHFFTARVAQDRPLSKALGFRTIVPDGKHAPTLVLARSVSSGAEETDSDAGESVYLVSRPETPLDTTTSGPPSTNALDAAQQHSSTDGSQDGTRPRRSFSITDLLSSTTKRQATAKARPRRLSHRAGQRVSSAPPTPTMHRRRSSFSYFADARRRVTDPALTSRNLATSAGPLQSAESHAALENEPFGGSLSQPLPEQSVRSAAPVSDPEGALASMPQLEVMGSAAALANHMPPSPTLAQSGVRPSRHSMAPSEQASTLVGSSDNEIRGLGSGDEDDADFQSETLFDSLRTGATKSTSGGPRGPRIETIFDESPPSKVKVTALRDLLPPGAFGEPMVNAAFGQHSIAEEEESISTPVRTVRPDRSLQDSPSFTRTHSAPLFPNLIPSSPPSMPKPLSLGTLEWDSRAGDDDSSRWSHEEEDAEGSWVDLPIVSHAATPVSLRRSNPRLLATGSSPKPLTPLHPTADYGDREARSSIFDWSEQQPADKSSGNRTPPRPRTVHGKKDADRRGSRSVGRRVPSGLHARSQSVPVVPDATGKRNTVVTNKFGTWGVGSKGVTEDWNDDFDFSELNEDAVAEDADQAPRVDSGTAMVVPKSIQEQQNNVLANIGLLREWGLLIEELKEHKVRAVALGIINGPHSGVWEEVDAMIDLADQEADHEGVSGLSPPSSPGFDEDAFEDPGASPSLGRRKRKSASPSDEIVHNPIQSQQPRRKTILPPNHGIFGPQSSPIPSKSTYETPRKTSGSQPIITRPRKDSEAKARSVIEALQNRRSVFQQSEDAPLTPSAKKVPFDTATLRRIVPYVNTLTRKVKDAIRDAEGLYSSPNASPRHEEPPFSNLYQQDTDLAAQMHRMTVM